MDTFIGFCCLSMYAPSASLFGATCSCIACIAGRHYVITAQPRLIININLIIIAYIMAIFKSPS